MNILGLFKPEYFYQPKVALRRIIPFAKKETSEFVERELPWGMTISVRRLEEHEKMLSVLGVCDLIVTESLWRLTQPGELAVDVGANIGYMSSILAKRVGSSGSVYAFEAHPEIFKELKHNVKRWEQDNNINNISIQNLAVSDKSGFLKLGVPEAFNQNRGISSIVTDNDEIANKSSVLTVQASTLDEFLVDKNVGVLKIDVEGHEIQVLKGAENLLKTGRIRDCVFEEHNSYPTAVTNYFESMGYQVFRIAKGFKKPILLNPTSQDLISHWQPQNFLATINPQRVISLFEKSPWQSLS
ncbi:MAG: FkbM family methyltransferase [Cyanobacteriota bacterium ELA615]